ncbi:D-alanine--D-alanine ligase family protein [Tessaracoccus sp. OH4464_COT-324]|uniref:D-alanine--D-alanine ligase family protein n=1 Tax=Tessaracoccus sp. OH4464_COT-324 TaxID=2491059 RepID=UPI000F635662|nr:D-alanine--D-alanine ligase family protein [Tessaracoccus sp. OH4464_COT-324]RRD47498.1 D-alanine--D-alanine ligase [Tessaracoccus sp. OH4464_COT-324]
MSSRIRVALVFGGTSSEHSISCLTAASVLGAIDRTRFDVCCLGIARSGRWTQVAEEEVAAYAIVDGRPPEVAEPEADTVWLASDRGSQIATRVGGSLVDVSEIDVAFALLHGPFGEDGTIQGLFELMGIRYVGCGVTSSAVGMDKQFMRQAFAANGLPVGPYVVASNHRWLQHRDEVLAEASTLRFPVFVKPCRGGSSIGISRVTDPDSLVAAIEHAREFDPKVIVEEGIPGREIECAVLGDPDSPEGCEASPLGEVRVLAEGGFYDYETKYFDETGAALDIPAVVEPEVAKRIQSLAKQAFRALDCEGLARADFFLTPEGEVFINEVNTMPGFTRISMFPSLWHSTGMSYGQLVTRLIDLALERRVGLR